MEDLLTDKAAKKTRLLDGTSSTFEEYSATPVNILSNLSSPQARKDQESYSEM